MSSSFATSVGVILGLSHLSLPATAKSVANPNSLKSPDHTVSSVRTTQQSTQSEPKVHCSRTDPRIGKSPAMKLAKGDLALNPPGWVGNSPLEVFCRDVRINTIVVRYYCTVLRE